MDSTKKRPVTMHLNLQNKLLSYHVLSTLKSSALCGFCMVLIINSDYLPKKIFTTDFCNDNTIFSVM
jgi:hypothetical protein